MKSKVETPEPTLERLVQETSYRERNNAFSELNAGIAAILQPRGGYHVYSGSSNRHFLTIPPSASVTINRAGWPNQATIDPKEAEEVQRELVRITQEEKRLEAAAGTAKNQREALAKWGEHIGEVEDMLLLAGSVLSEEDRPAVMAYIAEHRRYIRTLNKLTDGLRF